MDDDLKRLEDQAEAINSELLLKLIVAYFPELEKVAGFPLDPATVVMAQLAIRFKDWGVPPELLQHYLDYDEEKSEALNRPSLRAIALRLRAEVGREVWEVDTQAEDEPGWGTPSQNDPDAGS